ncbi:hypothetical protein FKW77_007270 [Venturia effusa]|uniref:Uncharacterized protein n=1 Tax=Venturia effusa TaxID=50376 RepID=A0A517KZP0_9PEZI|nr:hypothetical protein FKW77_007270 [Venturia effusa]
MASLHPKDQLTSTHSTLTADLTSLTTKYNYASAGLKAVTAQWERINAAADLCAALRVKKAKLLADHAGWQRDLLEVEEILCVIKERESIYDADDVEAEAAQLREKKALLKALLEKVPEAVRSVDMLVGPAEQEYISWSNREIELLRRMREWRNCATNSDGWEMKKGNAAPVDRL